VRPNWSFDGADEVSPEGYFLKGRGGAMFREKILMVSSPTRYLLVDRSKLVDRLGQTFPVPVEVYPEALHHVESELPRLGATSVELRLGLRKDGPVITEAGNLILDAAFSSIESTLERDIKAIPGVIESGLFIGYDVNLLVGD
jgi:ribose 5-phosphate isomerase A